MQKHSAEKDKLSLDLVGLRLDSAANIIHECDPEIRLYIHETKSYKDHELRNVYDGMVIKQKIERKVITLTIGYF